MKKIQFSALALFAAVILTASCSSSDSDSKTAVKYEIQTDTNMTTSIMYRNAEGDMVQGLDDIILDWDKTVNVETPFNAHMDVTFVNASSNTENFMISIYEDGEIVDHQMGSVPPNATISQSVDYDIE